MKIYMLQSIAGGLIMENDLHKSFVKQLPVDFVDTEIVSYFNDFQEFMMMYNCAIKEVKTKFEVLNDELAVANKRNPIEMIKSRVKKPKSIFEKLKRKGLPLNMNSILNGINDVAGVRIICSFVDDIYEIAKMFAQQDDITVVEVKDYIKSPKPNGYRSYHMIIEVPVFFSNRKMNMKVEVQLRTIAMDFWASLEHTIKYKKNIDNADEIILELKNCADLISETDLKMQSINNRINDCVNP